MSSIGDGNRLLEALARAGVDLRAEGQDVPLRRGEVVVDSSAEYGSVYFPHAGALSLLVIMPDGGSAEAALVGREGVVGHPYLADFEASPARAVVQIDGAATRLPGERLHQLVETDPAVRQVFGQFARAFLVQCLQTAACNALHGMEERFAKGLLQAADRVGGRIRLTHEFLAQTLGVSRPRLSLVAGTMQTAGLVRYRRAEIEILDRQGLEEAACPCYRAIRRAYQQLLPLTYA